MTYLQCDFFGKVKQVNYYVYLKSKTWKEKRKRRLLKDKYKCQFITKGVLCLCKEKLEVHHLTYERLGKEKMSDLITLCHNHHKETHNLTIEG